CGGVIRGSDGEWTGGFAKRLGMCKDSEIVVLTKGGSGIPGVDAREHLNAPKL
ncbi:hypothetical protein A2U01_0074755, partial [Trifolium medium]|nr:hypothetical protein [Trifolium medium]